MKKFILYSAVLLIWGGLNAEDPIPCAMTLCTSSHGHIFKIDSLLQLHENKNKISPHETFYFFDIDDTLIDSAYLLGSKAWRRYIVAATQHDTTYNWHDHFSYALARDYPLRTVESITAQFVQNLQSKGHLLFGLTARERTKWYQTPMPGIDVLTVDQLNSCDIDFQNNQMPLMFRFLESDSEYFKGIFFCDVDAKGDYLIKLFENASYLPKRVVFIDDKLSQVESVSSVLNQLCIEHECYWYCATDEKNIQFDPLIANIQLYFFIQSEGKKILSDQEAAIFAKNHPDQTANDYLQAAMLLTPLGHTQR